MTQLLFSLNRTITTPLHLQLRENIKLAIQNGQLTPNQVLPSCRKLAELHNISRSTVTNSYDSLVSEGWLTTKSRSGYFVNTNKYLKQYTKSEPRQPDRYSYPFILQHYDPDLFPFCNWQECDKHTNSQLGINKWGNNQGDTDDPLLIEQIIKHVLPKRGITASHEEVLITLGNQNSNYLLQELLFDSRTTLYAEETSATAHKKLLTPNSSVKYDYIYLRSQSTGSIKGTISLERKYELLISAHANDSIVIEDDCGFEMDFTVRPEPSLKSIDKHNRVIYLGSFSSILAPDLRIGFIVGCPTLIRELRKLRALAIKHPPANIQHTLGLFLERGYYDSLIAKKRTIYKRRDEIMQDALNKWWPNELTPSSQNNLCYWFTPPKELSIKKLVNTATSNSILVESNLNPQTKKSPYSNEFGLSYTYIKDKSIHAGVKELSQLIQV